MDTIERNSEAPYYQQLARLLEKQIKSGDYKAGDRFPGESELSRTYDLARSTVRETLRSLEQSRLIHMVPRRGAFVCDLSGSHWNLQVTQGFLEPEAHSPDHTITTHVLHSVFEQLPYFATTALSMSDGANGFVMERVRSIDGTKAIYSINYMPADVGAVLTAMPVLDGSASLNETLRDAGFAIYSARREVAAVAANAQVAKQLQVSKGAPVVLIQSLSCTENGRAFDFYQSYVRSDVVTVSVDAKVEFPLAID